MIIKKIPKKQTIYTGNRCLHCNKPVPYNPDMSNKANAAKKFCSRTCFFAANSIKFKQLTKTKEISVDMRLLFIAGYIHKRSTIDSGIAKLTKLLSKQNFSGYLT